MSSVTKVASQVRGRREESMRQKQPPSQSTIHISSSVPSPLQYYLLLFVDDNEHVIVPEEQIREFVKGQAVVLIGRQRRIGRIEVQGQYEIFTHHH